MPRVARFARGGGAAALVLLLLPVGSLGVASGGGLGGPPAGPAVAHLPSWTRDATGSAHPPGLIGASMADDAAAGFVLLFGGEMRVAGVDLPSNETWSFRAGVWTELHPAVSPPARWYASMAYDPAARAVVLFGGVGASGGKVRGPAFPDTWEFSAGNWKRLAPRTAPPARYWAAMTYDAALRAIVLGGGVIWTPHTSSNGTDFWAFARGNWTELTRFNPVLGPGVSLGYDVRTGQVVLWDGSGGTATYANGTWTNTPTPGPPTTWDAPFLYDPGRSELLLIGFAYVPNASGIEVWSYAGSGWTNETNVPVPPARIYFAAAYDAADHYTVLFGGLGSTSSGRPAFNADTWLLR